MMKKCLLPLKADLEPATALIRRYVLAGTKKPVPVSRHRESTLFFPKVKKMTGILYGRHESVLTSFRMLPLPVAGSYQDGYYDGRHRPPRGLHHKDRWADRPPHGRAYGHRKKRFDRDDRDD